MLPVLLLLLTAATTVHPYAVNCSWAADHGSDDRSDGDLGRGLDKAIKLGVTGDNNVILYNQNPSELLDRTIHFHIVTSPDAPGANISRQTIDQQIGLLNEYWSAFNVTFNLGNVSYASNATWYNAPAGSAAEHDMKAALHTGLYSELNIYVTNLRETSCTVPLLNPSADDISQDGCRVSWSNITSGTCDYYMKGIMPVWYQLEVLYGSNPSYSQCTAKPNILYLNNEGVGDSAGFHVPAGNYPLSNFTSSLCGLVDATIESDAGEKPPSCTDIRVPVYSSKDSAAAVGHGTFDGLVQICLEWSQSDTSYKQHCSQIQISSQTSVMSRIYSSLFSYRVFSTHPDGYVCLLEVPFYSYHQSSGLIGPGTVNSGHFHAKQGDRSFASGTISLGTGSTNSSRRHVGRPRAC